MSKNIAISDDVYRRPKREKGDRSFSELIEERLDRGGRLADVTGQNLFGVGTRGGIRNSRSTGRGDTRPDDG